jgi:hypothetical protein
VTQPQIEEGPLPYIEHDPTRLFFVPVLRQRLNFAVLVQRALRELAPWTDRDLIAIALPPSVLVAVRGALRSPGDALAGSPPRKALPVSLVIASWGDSDYREVFPITPCDGVIEAVRYAEENHRPIEAIDCEIKPGHLIPRRCLDDPNWPDDDLVLRWGPARYLDLIADRIEQPPTRFEPIDTWREVRMAERLRALRPRYHRILVVCETVHVRAVRRLLRVPSRPGGPTDEPAKPPGLQVLRAKPEVMIQYLDDIPRLTEFYERERRRGKAADFDKLSALIGALHTFDDYISNPFTTRRLLSFHRYLLQLLEQARRVSPRPYEVLQACRGCFGNAMAARIVHHLGGYAEEIAFERIGELIPDRTPVYEVRTSDPGPGGPFGSRSCNSTRPQYQILPRPLVFDRDSSDLHPAWASPSERFLKRMRQKSLALASLQEQRPRVIPFRGSLENGIHVRRTLRSLLTPTPTVYVKAPLRGKIRGNYTREPIVWVLQAAATRATWFNGYEFLCTPARLDPTDPEPEDSELVVMRSNFLGPDIELFSSEDGVFKLSRRKRLGFLSFFESEEDDIASVKKEFGPEFDRRMLRHSLMNRSEIGCVLRELEPHAQGVAPWWETLMLTALRFARETVVCVVPDGFRLPSTVVAEASSRRIHLACARLTHFSKVERSRLETVIFAHLPKGTAKDKDMSNRVRNVMKKLGIDY